MVKKRSLSIALASAVAVTSMCLLMGVRDAKAQSMGDLLNRIEALESRSGGNVTTKARGLKIGLQIRTRIEMQKSWVVNTGATRTRNADGTYTLSEVIPLAAGATGGNTHRGVRDTNEFVVQRVRLTFDADVNKNVRGFMMIDDNRTFGGEQSTTGFETLGMREGYAELRNLGDISPILENINVRLGRWQMFYGDHRLIGHLNWTNTGRAWDGARVRWDNKKGSWVDFFATSVSETTTGAASGDAPSATANRDELFWGLYSHFKNPFGVEGILAEPYIIIRDRQHDSGVLAGEDRWTGGLRLVGKKIPSLPGVDFTFEQAWQWGSEQPSAALRNSNSIQAFAGAWGAGYTFSNVAWSPRIGYQFAIASGDDHPGGNTTAAVSSSNKTFSQLYPTGHARLGYMDFHGWMNIQAHKIMFSAKPSKKLLLKADLWFFEADEEVDNWYSVAGGTNRVGGDNQINNQTGVLRSIDDEYGQELDITVKYKLFKNFGVVAGYSHYFTGDFMEDTNNDLSRDTDWAYLMTSLKF